MQLQLLSALSVLYLSFYLGDFLKFAKIILGVLSLLLLLGGLSEMIHPDNQIFEACKTILPPIATLVIGSFRQIV